MMVYGMIAFFILAVYCLLKWKSPFSINAKTKKYLCRIFFILVITAFGFSYEAWGEYSPENHVSGMVIGIIAGLIIDSMNEMSRIRTEGKDSKDSREA